MHDHWTRDSGIVGLSCMVASWFLGRLSIYLERRQRRRHEVAAYRAYIAARDESRR